MPYTLNRRAVLAQAALQDLTLSALAEKAGIHRVTLSEALRREGPSEPTLRTLDGLARALQVPIGDLLESTDAA